MHIKSCLTNLNALWISHLFTANLIIILSHPNCYPVMSNKNISEFSKRKYHRYLAEANFLNPKKSKKCLSCNNQRHKIHNSNTPHTKQCLYPNKRSTPIPYMQTGRIRIRLWQTYHIQIRYYIKLKFKTPIK